MSIYIVYSSLRKSLREAKSKLVILGNICMKWQWQCLNCLMYIFPFKKPKFKNSLVLFRVILVSISHSVLIFTFSSKWDSGSLSATLPIPIPIRFAHARSYFFGFPLHHLILIFYCEKQQPCMWNECIGQYNVLV